MDLKVLITYFCEKILHLQSDIESEKQKTLQYSIHLMAARHYNYHLHYEQYNRHNNRIPDDWERFFGELLNSSIGETIGNKFIDFVFNGHELNVEKIKHVLKSFWEEYQMKVIFYIHYGFAKSASGTKIDYEGVSIYIMLDVYPLTLDQNKEDPNESRNDSNNNVVENVGPCNVVGSDPRPEGKLAISIFHDKKNQNQSKMTLITFWGVLMKIGKNKCLKVRIVRLFKVI